MFKNGFNTGKNNKKELFSKKIRDSYYNKLIIKHQWNPLKKEKIVNNLFFFDWDDTLLCTTFISNNNYDFDSILKNPNYHDLLYKLEDKVFEILSLAIQKGETYIITNAEKSWVEYTSQIFFPSILNTFISLLLNILFISLFLLLIITISGLTVTIFVFFLFFKLLSNKSNGLFCKFKF